MQNYLLRNLSELAQRRAVLIREEAQLWDILSRDLVREAKRLDEAASHRPTKPTSQPQLPAPTNTQERKLLVGIAEAARLMGLGRSSVYREIAAGRLKVRKAGKRTLVATADIEEWCESLPDSSIE